MSYNLKKLIKSLIREINELECMSFLGRRFLRNYKRLKLSLNEIERLLLRFEDMYDSSWLQITTGKTAEEYMLHAQWKLLYLEQRVEENARNNCNLQLQNLIQEINAPCRYQRWAKESIFRSVSYFMVDSGSLQLNLILQTQLKGGDDRDYMSIKIALRRLLLKWKSFLLDKNGSVIRITCIDRIQLNKSIGTLQDIVPRQRGLFGSLLNKISFNPLTDNIVRSSVNFKVQEENEYQKYLDQRKNQANQGENLANNLVKLEESLYDQIQLIPQKVWDQQLLVINEVSNSQAYPAGFQNEICVQSHTDQISSKKVDDSLTQILSQDVQSQINSNYAVQ